MSSPKDRIITLPNPHLRNRSKKVGIVDGEIKQLIYDMQDALLDWEKSRDHEVGIALAAIQIDKPIRIVVVRNNYDNKEDKTFTVFINPTISKYEGSTEEDFEGCLSIKDIYGRVPRYTKIRVKAQDINGKIFRKTINGFIARVLQHEIDHTNGLLFIDYIKDNTDAFFSLKSDGSLEQLSEKEVRSNSIFR